VQYSSSQNLFILHAGNLLSRLMPMYFGISPSKTSLNVPDTMGAFSCFRDMNKISCLLICTIPYLIKTPAPDMRTCWTAACWRWMVTCFRYASSEFPALASTGYHHELILVQRSRWRKLFCGPQCRNYSCLDVECCKLPKI